MKQQSCIEYQPHARHEHSVHVNTVYSVVHAVCKDRSVCVCVIYFNNDIPICLPISTSLLTRWTGANNLITLAFNVLLNELYYNISFRRLF